MPIIFEQLAPSQDADEITVRGSVGIDGYALGQAGTGNAVTVIGAVAVAGNATLDSEFGEARPVAAALIDGAVFVSGFGLMGSVVSSRLDIEGGVSPRGEAYSDPVIEGAVLIGGEAGAGGSYQGGHTFIVEPQAVIACYVGQAFGSVQEGLWLGTYRARMYAAVTGAPVRLGSTRATQFDGGVQAAELLQLGDHLSWVLRVLASSGLTFATLAAGDYQVVGRAVSRLILAGSACSYAEALQQVADALVWQALSDAVTMGEASDVLAFGDTADHLYSAVAAAIERLVLAGRADSTYALTLMVHESFVLGAGATHEAELAAQLDDAIGFAMSLSFDSGEYIAWVMNTESRGLSRYTNYPFNSFAKIGGRYYGAHAGGIARLGGRDDMGEPIRAKLRLGMFDFGARHLKSFSDVFIGMAASGQMLLKAIFVDEQSGEKNMAIYKVLPRPAGASRETRARIGRGMKAVDWDFELENVDGADFDLKSIQFYPTQLSRRTRG